MRDVYINYEGGILGQLYAVDEKDNQKEIIDYIHLRLYM